MTADSTMPPLLLAALKSTDRSPGWNNRSREVQRFYLGRLTLFVVPYRRWVNRREDKRVAAWRQAHEKEVTK